jgi:exonuclease VII large subunit
MENLIKLMKEKLGEDVITEELTSEFNSNFEVTLNEKVQEKLETLKEELEEKNENEIATFKESLVESIDSYIEYAADEYLKENKVAIESNSKVEAATKILENLKETFKTAGLDIPADEVEKVKELEEKIETTQDKLNESITESIESKKKVFELEKEIAFIKKTETIEESKISDIEDLLEGLEFKDIEDYKKKIDIVISKVGLKKVNENKNEFENLDDDDNDNDNSIDKYLS